MTLISSKFNKTINLVFYIEKSKKKFSVDEINITIFDVDNLISSYRYLSPYDIYQCSQQLNIEKRKKRSKQLENNIIVYFNPPKIKTNKGINYFTIGSYLLIPDIINIYTKIEKSFNFWPRGGSFIDDDEKLKFTSMSRYFIHQSSLQNIKFNEYDIFYPLDATPSKFYNGLVKINSFIYGSTKILNIFNTNVFIHHSLFILLLPTIFSPYDFSVLIFLYISVLLHEFGHLLSAKKLNYQTGDITLSPLGGIAHINFSPKDIDNNIFDEIIISIAGPIVSFILSIIFFSFNLFIYEHEFFTKLGSINLSLGLFNLLPIFPMDGGRVFRACMIKFSKNGIKIANIISMTLISGMFIYYLWNLNIFMMIMMVFIYILHKIQNKIIEDMKAVRT